MRTLARILAAVGLALAVGTTASATISVDLNQIGGTYAGEGLAVVAGDTLVLEIVVSSDGLGPDTGLTIADTPILYAGVANPGGTATEAAFHFINGVVMTPLSTGFGDSGTVVTGWDMQTLSAPGAPSVPAWSTQLGTFTVTLTGATGVITFDATTTIAGANFVDITGASNLDSFQVGIIPEPTTASLLGMGLLGLTIAGRRRKN